MTDHDPDLTAELRRRLAEQARRAPSGDGLAEQIIARAHAGAADNVRPLHRRPPHAPWGRILATAAAVVAVAGVAVAITQYDPGTDHQQAGRSTAVTTPPPSPTPSTSSPQVQQSSVEPTTASTGARTVTVPDLTAVKVVDITFTGSEDGWGLASANCLRTSGRCTALLRTTDGAKSWEGRPNTPFSVPGVNDCAAPCVTHIRFATDDIGYAYGPSALFITTDGAQNWTPLDGGADAIETLDQNVIRVSSDASSCPPGCKYTVQVADIGSKKFTDVDLPGAQGAGDAVSLSRSGKNAYLLSTGNPAGGAQALSTLWTSSDDGQTWRNRGEPCSQSGGEVDSRSLTTAADGSVVVVCRIRTSGAQSVAVSTDGGAQFTTGPAVLGAADITAVGAASADVVLVSSDDTYRSTDGGRTFTRLGANSGSSPGAATYLGFSSDTDAHAISTDGRTIFTTHNAGRSWTAVRLG